MKKSIILVASLVVAVAVALVFCVKNEVIDILPAQEISKDVEQRLFHRESEDAKMDIIEDYNNIEDADDKSNVIDKVIVDNGNIDDGNMADSKVEPGNLGSGFSIDERCSANVKNIGYVDDFGNYAYGCAMETFFSDEKYDYMFSSMISSYIEVEYNDGTKEKVKAALNSGHIEIKDLDKFGIKYLKEVKNSNW